jgi:hypothetical protein
LFRLILEWIYCPSYSLFPKYRLGQPARRCAANRIILADDDATLGIPTQALEYSRFWAYDALLHDEPDDDVETYLQQGHGERLAKATEN